MHFILDGEKLKHSEGRCVKAFWSLQTCLFSLHHQLHQLWSLQLCVCLIRVCRWFLRVCVCLSDRRARWVHSPEIESDTGSVCSHYHKADIRTRSRSTLLSSSEQIGQFTWHVTERVVFGFFLFMWHCSFSQFLLRSICFKSTFNLLLVVLFISRYPITMTIIQLEQSKMAHYLGTSFINSGKVCCFLHRSLYVHRLWYVLLMPAKGLIGKTCPGTRGVCQKIKPELKAALTSLYRDCLL